MEEPECKWRTVPVHKISSAKGMPYTIHLLATPIQGLLENCTGTPVLLWMNQQLLLICFFSNRWAHNNMHCYDSTRKF
eukprot:c21670_g1_i1 orf=512-745(+)